MPKSAAWIRAHPLHDDAVKEIRQALLKWKVVFFPGQNIDHAAQVAFTARFGEVTYAHPHEDEPIEGFSQILPIDRSRYERRNGLRRSSYESRWHTDVTAVFDRRGGVTPPLQCGRFRLARPSKTTEFRHTHDA